MREPDDDLRNRRKRNRLGAARPGVYEFETGDQPSVAYASTAGNVPLGELCDVGESSVSFGEDLKRHIIFAKHSLVTDGSLNEFHVILARGVLRHLNCALQFRVHNLFLSSLIRLGFLCLSTNESLRMTPHEGVFRRLTEAAPIYRRMRYAGLGCKLHHECRPPRPAIIAA